MIAFRFLFLIGKNIKGLHYRFWFVPKSNFGDHVSQFDVWWFHVFTSSAGLPVLNPLDNSENASPKQSFCCL